MCAFRLLILKKTLEERKRAACETSGQSLVPGDKEDQFLQGLGGVEGMQVAGLVWGGFPLL